LDEVLDGDSELVTKLQEGTYEQLSEEKRKVAGLAQKVAEHPDQVSESDIKELGEFGFTTSEIIELISTASLAVSSNIVVDTLSISLSNKEEHPSSM
jgi:alkylhydroperoxidase family enzyme